MYAFDIYHVPIGDLYYHLDDKTMTAHVSCKYNENTMKCNENYYIYRAEIPDSVTYSDKKYAVVEIYSQAFAKSRLNYLTIPNTIKTIGSGICKSCSQLKSVVIDDGITDLNYDVFSYCTALTSVQLGKDLTSIPSGAFSTCRSLESIELPESVTSIGTSAFSLCSSLAAINIPNKVTEIGNYAFEECTSLTAINIPNSVKEIGNYAYQRCTGVKTINIGSSVTRIGANAFTGCKEVESIVCHAVYPPMCGENPFSGYSVDDCIVNFIPVYVPDESVNWYKADSKWSYFLNIRPMSEIEPVAEGEKFDVLFIDKDEQTISAGQVSIQLPEPPVFEDFTFIGWQVIAGDLKNGLKIQAVYQLTDQMAAPSVYYNTSNPAQKLIREGNIYILRSDHTYTLTGQEIR
jgi:hypothetical protein